MSTRGFTHALWHIKFSSRNADAGTNSCEKGSIGTVTSKTNHHFPSNRYFCIYIGFALNERNANGTGDNMKLVLLSHPSSSSSSHNRLLINLKIFPLVRLDSVQLKGDRYFVMAGLDDGSGASLNTQGACEETGKREGIGERGNDGV